jgi:hypothetical protein
MITEGTELLLTIQNHEFIIMVCGIKSDSDGSNAIPSTVIHHHSKTCPCGMPFAPSTLRIPDDYNEGITVRQ